ncbi:DedA family protein [Aneurinibacillus tyrosinisolvens]|uniref:DedA family protein n=1 Tax=Aneurinibacillus tyrosinisolvens TaxID=1443435 RepID=UPI00063F8231|nr:DedA family protein [Aneurinibacillus tyrosinisolvens]
MNVDTLVSLVNQYGYAALFFCLWLGIVGMPIPDEVVVMTGGFVVSAGLLDPVPAFLLTYLGVVSGLSLGYFLGRWMGPPVLKKLHKKKNIEKYLNKSYGLINRFGSYSLCISYFFPIVRHLVPYLVGIGKVSFSRYACFSYSTGFIWTLCYFTIGRLFGKHIEKIGAAVHDYGLWALGVFVIAGGLFWLANQIRSRVV